MIRNMMAKALTRLGIGREKRKKREGAAVQMSETARLIHARVLLGMAIRTVDDRLLLLGDGLDGELDALAAQVEGGMPLASEVSSISIRVGREETCTFKHSFKDDAPGSKEGGNVQ